ncbi:hypothetical protein EV359DRAFT_88205, partial [Lentinula novae-zelandiae]
KLKERRKAKEEARKKVEEAAAKQAAEEEKARQEAATRAALARKIEEEAAEKRRQIAAVAAARNRRGPSPGEASTSARRAEVEIPWVVRKGKGRQRTEASGGDPDDGGDSGDDDNDDEEERAPCERCHLKKIPCLEQVKREGGPSGEQMAIMESQMAQGLADLWALREAHSRSQQYLCQLLKRQDEDHARLIAIETRLAMAGLVTPGPSRVVSEKPRNLKRRRIIEESEEDQEDQEKEEEEGKEKEGGEEEEEEGDKSALKKAQLEKGKEREEWSRVEYSSGHWPFGLFL